MEPKHVSGSANRSLFNACVRSHWWRLAVSCGKCNTVVSNHFHSVKILLFSCARSRDFDGMFSIGLPVSMYTTQNLIELCHFSVRCSTFRNKILTFSVKDRYQLNYFICIKDFNAETITSLKLNLFSFFFCCC